MNQKNSGQIVLHRAGIVLALEIFLLAIPLGGIYWGLLSSGVLHAPLLELSNKEFITPNSLFRVAVLLILLEVLRRHYNPLFILGSLRVIKLAGRFSLRMERTSIAYSDIREIQIQQSVLGRLLRYGALYLGTASTGKHEIIFHYLARPWVVARVIEMKMRDRRAWSDEPVRGTPMLNQPRVSQPPAYQPE